MLGSLLSMVVNILLSEETDNSISFGVNIHTVLICKKSAFTELISISFPKSITTSKPLINPCQPPSMYPQSPALPLTKVESPSARYFSA